MSGEPNDYSWYGALDPRSSYSYSYSLGYRAAIAAGKEETV